MTEQERKKPFSYMHEGVLILLNRCDTESLNYVIYKPGTTDDEFLKAIICFTGHWMNFVYPYLNGFAGFDATDWNVIRTHCDHEAIVDDHMSGNLTYNLEYPDNYTDSSSGSGFENVNLVDRHRIDPDDQRHPHYDVARAVYDEIHATSGPDDREYGIELVESVDKFIGTSKEGRCYKVVVQYKDERREWLIVTMNESGTRFEILAKLPTA